MIWLGQPQEGAGQGVVLYGRWVEWDLKEQEQEGGERGAEGCERNQKLVFACFMSRVAAGRKVSMV